MASYLAFDPNVISQVSLLSKVGEEHYPAIFDAAITSLESSADEKQLSALVESTGAKASIISKIVQACSIMLWDLTKSAPRDPNVISDALQVMGMTKKVTSECLLCSCNGPFRRLKLTLIIVHYLPWTSCRRFG